MLIVFIAVITVFKHEGNPETCINSKHEGNPETLSLLLLYLNTKATLKRVLIVFIVVITVFKHEGNPETCVNSLYRCYYCI